MKLPRDRRAVAFLVFALLSLLLVPLAPLDLRWVGEVLSGLYFVMAVLSWLDNASQRKSRKVS